MTKPRKQRLYRISRAFDDVWCALIELGKHEGQYHPAVQSAGSALNYLHALAKKAK